MKPFAPLVAGFALAACIGVPPPVTQPGGIIPQSTCGADRLQAFVGQPVGLLPNTDPTVILRIIRPGDAVTEDFSLQRLNARLDAQDRITSLTCG